MSKNELYGSLKNFSNIGESGIRTGGKYREDKPSGKDHSRELIKEVNGLPRWNGGRVMRTKGGTK